MLRWTGDILQANMWIKEETKKKPLQKNTETLSICQNNKTRRRTFGLSIETNSTMVTSTKGHFSVYRIKLLMAIEWLGPIGTSSPRSLLSCTEVPARDLLV